MRFRTFRQSFGPFGFRFGWWGPYGFAGVGGRPFARPFLRKGAYLRWLRRYQSELEEELRDVEEELRELEAEEKEESEAN